MRYRWMMGLIVLGLCGCQHDIAGPSSTALQASTAIYATPESPVPLIQVPAEEHHYELNLAQVKQVDVLGQVSPQVVALPLYPNGSVEATRQVRLHFADGHVYREMEVVLSTQDGADPILAWYQQQGRNAYRSDTPPDDATDYRIWVRDDAAGQRRITLLRFLSD